MEAAAMNQPVAWMVKREGCGNGGIGGTDIHPSYDEARRWAAAATSVSVSILPLYATPTPAAEE